MITIRAAKLDDIDTLIRWNQDIALSTENKQLDENILRPGIERVINGEINARYFIAEYNEEAAGSTMLTYEWSDWRNAFFWWIQSVYTDPQFRRRGVFRTMHNYIQSQAHLDTNCCGLRLYVEQHNNNAKAVYEKVGMRNSEYKIYEEDWS